MEIETRQRRSKTTTTASIRKLQSAETWSKEFTKDMLVFALLIYFVCTTWHFLMPPVAPVILLPEHSNRLSAVEAGRGLQRHLFKELIRGMPTLQAMPPRNITSEVPPGKIRQEEEALVKLSEEGKLSGEVKKRDRSSRRSERKKRDISRKEEGRKAAYKNVRRRRAGGNARRRNALGGGQLEGVLLAGVLTRRAHAKEPPGETPVEGETPGGGTQGEESPGDGSPGEKPEEGEPPGELPGQESPGEGPSGGAQGEESPGEGPPGEKPDEGEPPGELPGQESPGEGPSEGGAQGEESPGEGPPGEKPDEGEPPGELPGQESPGEGPSEGGAQGEESPGDGPPGEKPEEGEQPRGELPEQESPGEEVSKGGAQGEESPGDGPPGEKPDEGEPPGGDLPEQELPGKRPSGGGLQGVFFGGFLRLSLGGLGGGLILGGMVTGGGQSGGEQLGGILNGLGLSGGGQPGAGSTGGVLGGMLLGGNPCGCSGTHGGSPVVGFSGRGPSGGGQSRGEPLGGGQRGLLQGMAPYHSPPKLRPRKRTPTVSSEKRTQQKPLSAKPLKTGLPGGSQQKRKSQEKKMSWKQDSAYQTGKKIPPKSLSKMPPVKTLKEPAVPRGFGKNQIRMSSKKMPQEQKRTRNLPPRNRSTMKSWDKARERSSEKMPHKRPTLTPSGKRTRKVNRSGEPPGSKAPSGRDLRGQTPREKIPQRGGSAWRKKASGRRRLGMSPITGPTYGKSNQRINKNAGIAPRGNASGINRRPTYGGTAARMNPMNAAKNGLTRTNPFGTGKAGGVMQRTNTNNFARRNLSRMSASSLSRRNTGMITRRNSGKNAASNPLRNTRHNSKGNVQLTNRRAPRASARFGNTFRYMPGSRRHARRMK
ncbi:unnamed protein product [Cylicocyclus nassatus]|uniref:Uncharacterized protein n=1 Tax=Cylicocyclus nassatus TaxID=53992 RepID=A0AA36HA65_CYLNA|nr:unnamed protein product [Cylicocyclus nassatus]